MLFEKHIILHILIGILAGAPQASKLYLGCQNATKTSFLCGFSYFLIGLGGGMIMQEPRTPENPHING
mgnify:CR=1 FL=1